MGFAHLPRRLLKDRLDLYNATVSQDSGAGASKSYSLAKSATPCMMQPAAQEVIDTYMRDELEVTHSAYLIDSSIYDATDRQDRIVFEGVNYEVVGKKDLSGLGRVFRVDLRKEVS